jgi:hypothetical protein
MRVTDKMQAARRTGTGLLRLNRLIELHRIPGVVASAALDPIAHDGGELAIGHVSKPTFTLIREPYARARFQCHLVAPPNGSRLSCGALMKE